MDLSEKLCVVFNRGQMLCDITKGEKCENLVDWFINTQPQEEIDIRDLILSIWMSNMLNSVHTVWYQYITNN